VSAETWHRMNPRLSPQSLPFIPAVTDSTKATTTFQRLHQEVPPKQCTPLPNCQTCSFKMQSLSRFTGDSLQLPFAISGRQHNSVTVCELRGLIRRSTWPLLLQFMEVYRDCIRRTLVLLRSHCVLCRSCRGCCS